jgi:hypothetical protein
MHNRRWVYFQSKRAVIRKHDNYDARIFFIFHFDDDVVDDDDDDV